MAELLSVSHKWIKWTNAVESTWPCILVPVRLPLGKQISVPSPSYQSAKYYVYFEDLYG